MLEKKPNYRDMNGKIKLLQSCRTSIRDAVAVTLSLRNRCKMTNLGTWKQKPLSSTVGDLKAIETKKDSMKAT